MGRYTEQARLLAVEDYCSGTAGHREVARLHGVEASSLRKWIAAYQALGPEGLKPKRKAHYSPEFKLAVIQRMREEHLSYRQAAAIFNIRRSDIIGDWECRYDEGGEAALCTQRAVVRETKMPSRPPTSDADAPIDKQRSHDDLIAELEQLRMENDY